MRKMADTAAAAIMADCRRRMDELEALFAVAENTYNELAEKEATTEACQKLTQPFFEFAVELERSYPRLLEARHCTAQEQFGLRVQAEEADRTRLAEEGRQKRAAAYQEQEREEEARRERLRSGELV